MSVTKFIKENLVEQTTLTTESHQTENVLGVDAHML